MIGSLCRGYPNLCSSRGSVTPGGANFSTVEIYAACLIFVCISYRHISILVIHSSDPRSKSLHNFGLSVYLLHNLLAFSHVHGKPTFRFLYKSSSSWVSPSNSEYSSSEKGGLPTIIQQSPHPSHVSGTCVRLMSVTSSKGVYSPSRVRIHSIVKTYPLLLLLLDKSHIPLDFPH